MPIEIESGAYRFSMRHRVERIALSVEDLSMRIARLTQMLSLDLSQDTDMLRVFRLDGVDESSRHRQQRMEELRGLLVMRYGMIRRYAQSLGAPATRSLFVCAQEQLAVRGLNPRVSGADVSRLFGET